MVIVYKNASYNIQGAREIILDGNKVHISFPLNCSERFSGFDQITLIFRDNQNAHDVFRFLSFSLLSKGYYIIKEIPISEYPADADKFPGGYPGVKIQKV